jgi:ABC-type sugar transport system ATPase subunit
VADTVVVLRRGRAVARRPVADVTGDRLVGLITGTIAEAA